MYRWWANKGVEEKKDSMIKTMYDRVMHYASRPEAPWVLFVVAFIESSFFIIPPDVLLIPMVLMHFDKAFKYAADLYC